MTTAAVLGVAAVAWLVVATATGLVVGRVLHRLSAHYPPYDDQT